MKNAIIAALIAVIAVGGTLGALAATQTVDTTANVEVTVWQRVADGSLYLSTRPEGGTWTTHETALDMSQLSLTRRFRQGSAITVAVPVSVTVDIAEPEVSLPEDSVPVDDPAGAVLGEGSECLTTTGCGFGYFEVPADTVLKVGVDIAPGKWNSDYESAGEDSCHAVRLDSSVRDHPGYVDDRPWTWSAAPGFSIDDKDWWFTALYSVEQPSGRYEPHSSVIKRYWTDYVYDPRTVTITLLPTDYALIIDGDCH